MSALLLSAEQRASLADSPLFNDDLAPVRPELRRWRWWNFAALWISMAACIPTYMLASSLIEGGMNWWEAVLTIFVGNLIVLIPMILNAHAGTKYGIPFPVYCRPAFGPLGANVPAMLRALVACGWFGIQTWIGGEAIFKILAVFFPAMGGEAHNAFGITLPQFLCFVLFWSVNMFVIYKGIDSIRILLNIKAPLLIALGLALLAWAVQKAGGYGPILSQPSAFDPGQPKSGQFWSYFPGALTGMVGFWATLSLNIPDFSRYARSQKDQILGQALGLPPTMALYSFIGVAVTSATTIIYGKAIWDPTDVLTRFKNPAVLIVAMFSLCIATLATWKLLADPSGYIFTWLVGYSALLGPIGGILIADYYVYRKRELNLVALYQRDGAYRHTGGFSVTGLAALVIAILPNLPGFLVTIHAWPKENVAPIFMTIYSYAWFVGFAVAFVVYLLARYMRKN